MIALKFLDAGRVAPFTGLAWPLGDWVESAGVRKCGRGVHACLPHQLPYWLGGELWEIELDGEIVRHERKVVASRGRLVLRREEWTPALLDDFGADVLRRTRAGFGALPGLSGYVADIERFCSQRRIGLAAFAAARAAELDRGPPGYEAERSRQASWLAARIGLDTG